MMKLVYSAKSIENDDSLDLLRRDWKDTPISIYIIDATLQAPPTKNELLGMLVNELHRKKRKSKRFSKRKFASKKLKIMNKLKVPKAVYMSQSMVFFFIFVYLIMRSTSFNFTFWLIAAAIPVYYYEIQKNVNNFYNKKLKEHNIPYESDQQKEVRKREETVTKRVDSLMKSDKWDEENFERKYSYFEIVYSLIYYFFMSFFPGYIERQLDIFQQEHNKIQTQKRIRDKKRDFERRKKEMEETEKAKQDIKIKEERAKVESFIPQKPSAGKLRSLLLLLTCIYRRLTLE